MRKFHCFVLLLTMSISVCLSAVQHVPSDYPSIQEAINAASDGDVVLIADGVYSGVGNQDISYQGKAITVESVNGPEQCIINCLGTATEPHRGFIFENDEPTLAILKGLTIKGGHATTGGSILTTGDASPHIINCHLIENAAEESGGGAFIEGNTILENCTITDNQASEYGGGVYCSTDTKVINTLLAKNVATLSGGGIYCIDQASVSGSIIENNHSLSKWAPFSFDNGGGGAFLRGSSSVKNCTIKGNTAQGYGGGVMLSGESIIESCTVTTNQSDEQGGGIYCSYHSHVMDTSVSGNTATDKGGGIQCTDHAEVSGSIIVSNHCESSCEDIGDESCGGGGVSLSDDSILRQSTIQQNTANHTGGGVHIGGNGNNCLVYQCSILDNRVLGKESEGGGISVFGGTIVESIISGNQAKEFGGGIACYNGHLSFCEISDNRCETGGGGGVYSVWKSEIHNCLITGNISDHCAGVFFCVPIQQSGDFVLEFSTVVNNTATDQYFNCGGVTCTAMPFSSGTYQISNSILWGNSGANFRNSASGNDLTVDHCLIQEGYEGTGNISGNPLFTLGPRGAFYLSNSPDNYSPCIDKGSDFSEFLFFESYPDNIYLDELTTQQDKVTDFNMVDIGYHYPTAAADEVIVSIDMPAAWFSPGDSCSCHVTVTNNRDTPLKDNPLFVLLNVYGAIYYAPGFTLDVSNYLESVSSFPVGDTTVTVLPNFTWPEEAGSASGIYWYAALLDPDMTRLFGDLDIFEFGWES